MANQPRSERKTQDRVITLFTDLKCPGNLGYRYLGDWHQRENNRPIGIKPLRAKPKDCWCSDANFTAAHSDMDPNSCTHEVCRNKTRLIKQAIMMQELLIENTRLL